MQPSVHGTRLPLSSRWTAMNFLQSPVTSSLWPEELEIDRQWLQPGLPSPKRPRQAIYYSSDEKENDKERRLSDPEQTEAFDEVVQ